jgi:acylpyruvate hydrolase
MKIIYIGRNYVDHANELNNPVPAEPAFFLKPESAVLNNGVPFVIPPWTNDVHFEVELLIRVNRLGKTIEERFAHDYYSEIGLGIDFTARDVQKICSENGLPWEKAKAFDGSAVVSYFFPLSELDDAGKVEFRLEVNGAVRQRGSSLDMLFNFDKIIAHVSQFMTLEMRDIIFTGTPAGVGKVHPGDELEGFIGDRSMFRIAVK